LNSQEIVKTKLVKQTKKLLRFYALVHIFIRMVENIDMQFCHMSLTYLKDVYNLSMIIIVIRLNNLCCFR